MNDELKVDQETLRYAVARQITCPIGGRVLDMRSALLAEVTTVDGNMIAVTAHVDEEAEFNRRLDRVRPMPQVKSIKVYDGRVLFA